MSFSIMDNDRCVELIQEGFEEVEEGVKNQSKTQVGTGLDMIKAGLDSFTRSDASPTGLENIQCVKTGVEEFTMMVIHSSHADFWDKFNALFEANKWRFDL